MSEKKTSDLIAIIARYEALYEAVMYGTGDKYRLRLMDVEYAEACAELDRRMPVSP
jgi:hypothetical protein